VVGVGVGHEYSAYVFPFEQGQVGQWITLAVNADAGVNDNPLAC